MAQEQFIWDFLKSQGFTDYGVAGLMGNLQAESGLNPKNLQNSYEKKLNYTDSTYTTAVDNGSYSNFVDDKAGYGLAQWTYWSRKQNLLNYSKSKKTSIGDLQMQLEFLVQELKTSYSKVYKTLLTAGSIKEASDSVWLDFERPANQSAERGAAREKNSQEFYNKYAVVVTIKPVSAPKQLTVPLAAPLSCIMTNSTCYKSTRKMTIKGVLWHSTGSNNPNLKRYVQPSENDANYSLLIGTLGKNANKNDWNHTNRQAGVNAFVGKDAQGNIIAVQTLPWDYRPWGCGSGSKGSCNDGFIQFEICEDSLNDKNYFDEVYKVSCELTAYLCQKYNLDPHGTTTVNSVKVPVILCHQDSYKLGLGSNHGDVLHWFKKYGKTMDDVRNDVSKLLQPVAIKQTPAFIDPPIIQEEDDEDMTQEKFNEMMDKYIEHLSEEAMTWEAPYMLWAQQKGLIVGNEKGELMPKKFITRGELATVLYRMNGGK